MNTRLKSETIEIGDKLIFDTGYESIVHSIIPMNIILEDNIMYSTLKLYVGVDTGHIKIEKNRSDES